MNFESSAWCCVVAVLVIILPRCYSAKDILTEFDNLNEDIWNYEETSLDQGAQKTLDTLCDQYDIFVKSKKISCSDISLKIKLISQNEGFEKQDRVKRQTDDLELEGSGESDDAAIIDPPSIINGSEKIESVINKLDELEELPSSISKIVDEEQSVPIVLSNHTLDEAKLNGFSTSTLHVDYTNSTLHVDSTKTNELSSEKPLEIIHINKEISKEIVVSENKTEQIAKESDNYKSNNGLQKEADETKEVNNKDKGGQNNSEKELKNVTSDKVKITSSEPPETNSDKQNSVKMVESPRTKEKETIDEQQDGNTEILLRQPVGAVFVKGSDISESEKILNNMEVSSESRSSTNIEKASKDTTILIVLFVVVVVIGGAAFTYNKVKQRKSQRSTISSNHVNEKTDLEQGTELKPLMKNDQKLASTITTESANEKS